MERIKKWILVFIVALLLTLVLFWGLSWLVTPASAHRHHGGHHHFGVWIGPPIIWAPPPVYRPYYPPPYYYYHPPQDYREWVPEHWEHRWNPYFGNWEYIWVPGYWRTY